jgi:trehalose 6-phosphate phosphatase
MRNNGAVMRAMRNILGREGREVLEAMVWSNVLLAFDYDGTLAPIVARPEQARLRAPTRSLLAQLTGLFPVIVITGRSQAQALEKLEGVGVLAVVGNHGIEPWYAARRQAREVQTWLPKLAAQLAPLRGVTIEEKVYSVAIHYRQSREKKKARAAIALAAQALRGARIIGGKHVVNVLPRGAPDKGIALERERARLRCDTAIYLGDDETDEDVFKLDQPGRLLSIRVGVKRSSAASWYLRGQKEVDGLLRAMIAARLAMVRQRRAAQ